MSKVNSLRISHIETKAKFRALAATRRPTDEIRLEAWQEERYLLLRKKRLRLTPAPTGAGKSILLQALAVHDRSQGYRCIITYPRRDIAPGFQPTLKFHLPGQKGIGLWSPEVVTEDIVEGLIKFLTRRDSRTPGFGVILCTHSALAEAYRRIKTRKLKGCWRNLSLFVDEVHHAQYNHEAQDSSEETNRLGAVITEVLGDKSNRVTVATATFFRTEGAIIPPKHLKDFDVRPYHIDEYLKSLNFLKNINIHLVTGPMIDSFRKLISDDPHRKTIVYHPNNYKRIQTDLLNAQLMNSIKNLKLQVANLVPQKTQTEVLSQLTESIKAEKEARGGLSVREIKRINSGSASAPSCTPDLAIAFNMLQEGFNWPAVSRGILLAPRGSLVMCLQILGRLLRDWPGKEQVDLYIIVDANPEGEIDVEGVDLFLSALFTYMVIGWQYKRAVRSVSKKPSEGAKKAEPILLDPKVLGDILIAANKRVIANHKKPGVWDEALQAALDTLVDRYPVLEERDVRQLVKRDFDEFWKSAGKSIQKDSRLTLMGRDAVKAVEQGDPAAILQFYTRTVGHRDLHDIRSAIGEYSDYDTLRSEVQALGVRNWKQYKVAREAFLAGKTSVQVRKLIKKYADESLVA